MTTGLSRRALLTAAGGLAAGGLASCAGAATPKPGHPDRKPGERVSLTFWSWVPGINAAVDLWNKRNPDVHVELENIVGGSSGGYAKLDAAVKAGGAPDLAQVEYFQLPAFMLDRGLLDLTPYGVQKHQDLFVPWQWRQGVFDQHVYAVPQASGPMAMFYRADLFDKWSIPVPRTWHDYRAAAHTVRKADPAAYLTAFPPANSAYQAALAWQAGAHWFTAHGDTWQVNLTDPATRRMCEYWDGMLSDRLVIAEQDQQSGWFAQLQQGRIASWIGPQWGDALLTGNAAGTSGKWRVAPMPQWDQQEPAAANWGGSSTAIMRGTSYPAEAIDFAVWLNTNLDSVNLLIAGGYGWPALTGAYQRTVLSKPSAFFGGQRYNAIFNTADKHIDDSWMWIPTQAAAFDHLNDAISAAMNSGEPLLSGMRTAQRQIVSDLTGKGLTARAT